MARTREREIQPSHVVRALASTIRVRRDALASSEASASEWRRLQFDAVHALVEAHRAFVGLHSQIVGLLGRDRPLASRLRIESLDLGQASDELRSLIRDIERVLVEH